MSRDLEAAGSSPLASTHLRAVYGAALFVMFGFGLVLPTLPLFAEQFGVDKAAIGLLATVFNGTRLVSNVLAGPALDRFGDRVVTGLGAVIVGLSSLAAGAAPSYWWLVGLRGIGGVGSAFFLGGLTAHLIGNVPPDQRGRAMGAFQGTLSLGFIAGPLFGGIIAGAFGLNAPLYAYGAICLAAAPMVLRAMQPDGHRAADLADASQIGPEEMPGPEVPSPSKLRPLLRDSAYRAALVTTAATFFGSGALFILVPLIWSGPLGNSDASVGTPITVYALASLAVLWHAGSMSDRYGRKATLLPSLLVSAAAMAVIGFVSATIPLLIVIGIAGLAGGYLRPAPTSIVADVATERTRAVAVSGYRTAGDIGAFIGPILVGWLAQRLGDGAGLLAVTGMFLLAFAVAAVARETAPSRAAA